MFLVLHTPVSTVSLVDLQFDVFVLHCPIMFPAKKWHRATSDSSGLVEAGVVRRRRREPLINQGAVWLIKRYRGEREDMNGSP